MNTQIVSSPGTEAYEPPLIETCDVTLTFNYRIKTDDIQRTISKYEFPIFPDLNCDTDVEFVDGTATWKKTKEESNV
jgi:hypothetical protein